VIAPVPAPGLTWARGSHETPRGLLRVEWHADGGDIRIEADIPAGTDARIVFPDGTEQLIGPGTFRATRPLPVLISQR
jgi:alpha-L-rhamnosidase